jgi:hypothetical protein
MADPPNFVLVPDPDPNTAVPSRPACLTLEARCVRGITANREALRQSVERSIGIVTALNPYIGYANATAVAQEAHASGRSVYEVVLEKGLLSKEKLEEVLRPEILTRPQPILVSVRTAPDVEGVGSVDIDTDLRVR